MLDGPAVSNGLLSPLSTHHMAGSGLLKRFVSFTGKQYDVQGVIRDRWFYPI